MQRVFISYRRESEGHTARVATLARRLREDGADVRFDGDQTWVPDGWQEWMEAQIRDANWVVCVFSAEYPPPPGSGAGAGAAREWSIIDQTLLEAHGRNDKFVPVYFDDVTDAVVPTVFRRYLRHELRDLGPHDPGYRRLLETLRGPREEGDDDAPEPAFVGRRLELQTIAEALLPGSRLSRRCLIKGMAGIGKTCLAERFAASHSASFPGGLCRLWLRPETAKTELLLEELAEILDIRATPAQRGRAIDAGLRSMRALLVVENVDDEPEALAVGGLAQALPNVPMLVTGRCETMGVAAVGWTVIPLTPLSEKDARTLLERRMGRAWAPQEVEPGERVLARLRGLPLALHLIGAWLRQDGDVLGLGDIFDVEPVDPVDPRGLAEPERATLARAFRLSLARLAARPDGAALVSALQALGHAPLAGFGSSLGMAIAGVDQPTYRVLQRHARVLSLLVVENDPDRRSRIHPLLAEWLRAAAGSRLGRTRADRWFRAQTHPLPAETRRTRWAEVRAERAGLSEWLAWERRPADAAAIIENSHDFAGAAGPYEAWARLCEAAASPECAIEQRSRALGVRPTLLLAAGQTEAALEAAKESCRLEENRPGAPYLARSVCVLAQGYEGRGDVVRALQLLDNEALPAARRARNSGVELMALRRKAGLLKQLGRAWDALELLDNEILPRSLRANDPETSTAIALRIKAEVLTSLGRYGEAERLLSEVLPRVRRRGDPRGEAVTARALGDVLVAAGRPEEALVLLRDTATSLADEFGDPRGRATAQSAVARALLALGRLADARAVVEAQLPVTRQLEDRRGEGITLTLRAAIEAAEGDSAAAERTLREEALPLYEATRNAYTEAIARTQLGTLLAQRRAWDDAIVELDRAVKVFSALGASPRGVAARRALAGALTARGLRGDAERATGQSQLADADVARISDAGRGRPSP